MMSDFYKKIVEPALDIESDELRKSAWVLENYKPDNDDNLFRDGRIASAEVLNRIARLKDFAEWIFSDELKKELDEI